MAVMAEVVDIGAAALCGARDPARPGSGCTRREGHAGRIHWQVTGEGDATRVEDWPRRALRVPSTPSLTWEPRRQQSRWTLARKAELRRLIADGASIEQLAAHFGIACSTMRVRLNDYGYGSHSDKMHLSGPPRPSRADANPRLARIQDARAAGTSVRVIAAREGISRNGVYNFLERARQRARDAAAAS